MSVRRLNEPRPARVQVDDAGQPQLVRWSPNARRGGTGQRSERVEAVLDTWYVDDGWWTSQPVRRAYHECQLEGGTHLVLVYDMVAERWFVQR